MQRNTCISEKNFPMYFVLVLALLLGAGSHGVAGRLPPCPSTKVATIHVPCRFRPGQHQYETLDIRSDVVLETSSSVDTQSFNVTGTFLVAPLAVVAMVYSERANTGAGHGHGASGGSHGGRGGAEKGRDLDAGQAVPYGSSEKVQSAGSRGGNGGKGGGLLEIYASRVAIEGKLRVNGEHGASRMKSGGGSGGGIAVECDELFGGGVLETVGGSGRHGGGGGSGGRISVRCTKNDFKGTFLSHGGRTGEGHFMLSIVFFYKS